MVAAPERSGDSPEMATSCKAVAASAGASLAFVAIGVAYSLGQQNAAPAAETPIVQTVTVPPGQPLPGTVPPGYALAPQTQPPTQAAAAPAPEATPDDEPRMLARQFSTLEGESLIGALWDYESQITQRVTYAQLERNADRYAGTRVVYSGEVMEIQDLPDQGGAFLRLAVDDNYDHIVAVAALAPPPDSIVRGHRARVYGELAGTFSYTSQANYQITIPKVLAVAVVPTSVPRRQARNR